MNDILQKDVGGHDELVEGLFDVYNLNDKNKVVSLFLSSFSSKNIQNRSGLSAFAVLQSFPKHKFELRKNQSLSKFSPCAVCSNWPEKKINTEIIDEGYKSTGGLIGHGLLDYFYYLKKTNQLENVTPTEENYRIFSEILEILINADSEETVKKTVQKQISKIKGFKSNTEQRQALLETLGYCSILETDEHKGLLNQYINLATAPSKTHSSDWNYPVDFWLGKDGINKEALKFWFEEHPQLQKFWK